MNARPPIAPRPAPALERLGAIIRDYRSVLVAYSGGVDSAVVLAVAIEQLPGRTVGIIGNSPAYPQSELAEALLLAERFHLPVRVIETDEHEDPEYLANTSQRCFFCRSHLFERLVRIASDEGYQHVIDGVHLDDRGDHVGGMKAARQHGVRSPLLEAGLGKQDVRAIAHQLGLPVWDKPALACLASRVPTGTPINVALLDRIGRAEQVLRDLGFVDFRVRHHGEMARLELHEDDMPTAIRLRDRIVADLIAIGYRRVALDLRPRAAHPLTVSPPNQLSLQEPT